MTEAQWFLLLLAVGTTVPLALEMLMPRKWR